ncbi:MAG: Na+/H+ antiporter subunit C [Chloroflexi bacterium]|nr:Na+/H+ antiporter subunit C [Chloroflexota bacterium]
MEVLLAFVIGVLYAAGIYMLMRRSMVKLILGLALLGHAANLLIFTVGRLTRNNSALIKDGEKTLSEAASDPLPQALILTAIVIGFGVQAFAIVLLRRTSQIASTDDFDQLSVSKDM